MLAGVDHVLQQLPPNYQGVQVVRISRLWVLGPTILSSFTAQARCRLSDASRHPFEGLGFQPAKTVDGYCFSASVDATGSAASVRLISLGSPITGWGYDLPDSNPTAGACMNVMLAPQLPRLIGAIATHPYIIRGATMAGRHQFLHPGPFFIV